MFLSLLFGLRASANPSEDQYRILNRPNCKSIVEKSTALTIVEEKDLSIVKWLKAGAEWAVGLKSLAKAYQAIQPKILNPHDFWRGTLEILNITSDISGDLSQFRQGESLVITSNHPFGFVDGVVLADLVAQHRQDYLILGNSLLAKFPEIREKIIPLEIMDSQKTDSKRQVIERNKRSIQKAVDHVQNGGALIVFPAGTVSTAQVLGGLAVDGKWEPTVAKIIRQSNSAVLPVFFEGQNPTLFHMASKAPGVLSEVLRVAMFPSMTLRRRNSIVRVRVGQKMLNEKLEILKAFGVLDTPADVAQYLKHSSYQLSQNPDLIELATGLPRSEKSSGHLAKSRPLAPEVTSSVLKTVLKEGLEDQSIEVFKETEKYQVLFARGGNIDPFLMHQISVLREKTFREVGEGTGKDQDTDEFDAIYDHLIVWDKQNLKITGAYRLGTLQDARSDGDFENIYSNRQFKYNPEFFAHLDGDVVELGRSFVVVEYQGSETLALLWSGIGEYIYRSENVKHLIGPVSISGDYSALAQTLIIEYLEKFYPASELLTGNINPKVGFPERLVLPAQALESFLTDNIKMSQLEKAIVNLEGIGIPPLVKYYFGMLGAQLVGVDYDPDFNTLDGLIMVNISSLNPKVAVRFIGNEERFQEVLRK